MKVKCSQGRAGFRYTIALHPEDRQEFPRAHSDEKLSLVRDSWEVRLPPGETPVHPDLHAAAVWLAVRPCVGERLELPFAVSERYARAMQRLYGVVLTRVDRSLSPRRRPARPRPGLLFSGGFDTSAASLLLPRSTALLHLARLPGQDPRWPRATAQSVRLMGERREARCRAAQAQGLEVFRVQDGSEMLFSPYPSWHSNERNSFLAALYLADRLALSHLEMGTILENNFDAAYRIRSTGRWRLRTPPPRLDGRVPEPVADATKFSKALNPLLGALGLQHARSIAGVSTVGTALVVARGPYHGLASPCDYQLMDTKQELAFPPDETFCRVCERCFKKGMLTDIFLGRETPSELVDQYLSQPLVMRHFMRSWFDWYHIWFYVFQHARCKHWFFQEMREQAKSGPDLGFLERWHPGFQWSMAKPYRAEVRRNIARYMPAMSAKDMRAMDALELPALRMPARLYRMAQDLEAAQVEQRLRDAAGAAEASRPEGVPFDMRCGHVLLLLRSRTGELPECRFCVGTARREDALFRRAGELGLMYQGPAPESLLELCWRLVSKAGRVVGEPPSPASSPRWRQALSGICARSRLHELFEFDVECIGSGSAGAEAG